MKGHRKHRILLAAIFLEICHGLSVICAQVVALGKLAELADMVYADRQLAKASESLAESVQKAIETHGVFAGNLTVPRMYAFEVDGFGASHVGARLLGQSDY